MAGRILLFFIALPLLEIWLLIKVGSIIGAGWTILLIIATTLIGGQLVRQQGLGVMRRAREQQMQGEAPAVPMLEGLALLMAGFCLILPGLITDAVGFLLLLPNFRSWAARRILSRAVTMNAGGRTTIHTTYIHGGHATTRPRSHGSRDEPTTIEGDYHRHDK